MKALKLSSAVSALLIFFAFPVFASAAFLSYDSLNDRFSSGDTDTPFGLTSGRFTISDRPCDNAAGDDAFSQSGGLRWQTDNLVHSLGFSVVGFHAIFPSSNLIYWNFASVGGAGFPGSCVGYVTFDTVGQTFSGLTPLATNTRIISVTPAASSTIATSSTATLGGSVFINSNDYVSGTYVEQKFVYQANALIVAANTQAQFVTFNYPISASGLTNFSTTTPVLRVGRYTMVTTIRNPSLLDSSLSFLGFEDFATFGTVTATTTTFTAGTLNSYDLLTDSMVNNINSYLASSTISLASCTNWTQLNLVDCMNLVFVPQWEPIKQAVDNFRSGFLTYWPWGYITRFATIMSGSATTTLPSFQVNMNNVLPPGTVDGNYTLDMNDMLAGGSAALDAIPARGGTANDRDILEPILRTFLALLVVIMIVRDLTKIGTHHNSAAAHGHV